MKRLAILAAVLLVAACATQREEAMMDTMPAMAPPPMETMPMDTMPMDTMMMGDTAVMR